MRTGNMLSVRGTNYGLGKVTYEASTPAGWVEISKAAIDKHMAEGGMVLWNSKES